MKAVLLGGAAAAAAAYYIYKALTPPATTNTILNPYTGEVVATVPFLSKEQAVAKLTALSEAQKLWAAVKLAERIAAIKAGADYMEANLKAIAADVTAAVGKPIGQSEFEVTAGVGKMRTLCDQAEAALAPAISSDGDFEYEVRRTPKGVIEIIVPWNYPIFTALNGVVPALLAGNAVALKHQSTPAVGDWFEKAFGSVGKAPIAHVHVDIPTSDWIGANVEVVGHRVFTGSVRGGRAIASTLGTRALNPALKTAFIGCSLELGGCDAAYVHKDLTGDDLKHAVEFMMTIGRLHNSGQSCCATKRCVVHPDAFASFEKLASANFAVQVCGDPALEKTTIGPNYGGKKLCESIFAIVLDAKAKGAKVVVAGEDCTGLDSAALKGKLIFEEKAGCFIVPTLLVNTTDGMRCMKEEVFGPVLAVAKAPTDVAAAIRVMNDTSYGLTNSVWTKDADVADAFVDGMNSGTCFVNWCNDVHAQVVWSGVGLSGNGNGAMGAEGFRVLTNPKSVVRRAEPMKFP